MSDRILGYSRTSINRHSREVNSLNKLTLKDNPNPRRSNLFHIKYELNLNFSWNAQHMYTFYSVNN